MFGHLGFSYVGLIFLVLLIVPNILWSRNPPEDYDNSFEHGILMLLERIGQVGCFLCALMFSDFNFAPFTPWTLWLVFAFAAMALYELCWVRYFKSRRRARNMYRSFYGIPVPLATLPVAAFVLLGVYGKIIWMILFSIIFGGGHIGIHLQHAEVCGVKLK